MDNSRKENLKELRNRGPEWAALADNLEDLSNELEVAQEFIRTPEKDRGGRVVETPDGLSTYYDDFEEALEAAKEFDRQRRELNLGAPEDED